MVGVDILVFHDKLNRSIRVCLISKETGRNMTIIQAAIYIGKLTVGILVPDK